ncbi:MAG: 2-dehydropantoate 2-reductase [Desulfobacteraceae bacterium]|jgi:2-dehydropantoate 2-reductase
MQILVVGAGAMGCLFAARLRKAGFQVTLFEKNRERAEKIDDQGISVQGLTGEYVVKVPVCSGELSFQPDLVLICVKSNDTKEASQTIKPWLNPNTRILTLQNGIGNLEILQQAFGRERVLGGVTAEGATVLGPGNIRHAGQGETVIGPAGGPESPVEAIVSAMNRAGFQTKAVEDVNQLIWGKLIINVAINALAAITGLKNGRLPQLVGSRMIMEQAVEEAVAVARAKTISLPYPDPISRVMEVCEATSDNVASMLQDVLNEKLTEIDFINGAIVREGEALGLATPVNFTLTALVHVIQETYSERI